MKSVHVVVRLRIEGFHCWAECPIEEVSFLRDRHRHIFHVDVTKRVTHSDRDVEIILLKREIEKWLRDTYGMPCEFGSMSCEHIAEALLDKFQLSSCTVTEDGENGGIVCDSTERHNTSSPITTTDEGTVWVVPIEPLDSRYTKQWYEAVPHRLSDLIRQQNLPLRVCTVVGEDYSGVTEGGFLNFALTNSYKASQLQEIAKAFHDGRVKEGDAFVVTDAWNPAVLHIRYMSDMLGIPVRIYGIWHAGSYDPTDLMGMRAGQWAGDAERAMFNACTRNYFATESHRSMFLNARGGDEQCAVRCGQPHYALTSELTSALSEKVYADANSVPVENLSSTERSGFLWQLFYSDRPITVVWPHRISSDKQVDFADHLSANKNLSIFITQRADLSKKEMYRVCGKSNVVLSMALHENLGIGVMEATLAGALPLVPDRCSYSEMYIDAFKYPSEWTSSPEACIANEDKLLQRIEELVMHRSDMYNSWLIQRNILLERYLTCDVMFDHVLHNK